MKVPSRLVCLFASIIAVSGSAPVENWNYGVDPSQLVSGQPDVDCKTSRTCQPICFDPDEVKEHAKKRRSTFWGSGSRIGSRSVSLEVRGWASHQLTTRIADILLREKLGLGTEILFFQRADQSRSRASKDEIYLRANKGGGEEGADGGVDINFEMWPAEARDARQEAIGLDAVYTGLVNYTGRNGWFIPAKVNRAGRSQVRVVDTCVCP
jgi:hypothetical protein